MSDELLQVAMSVENARDLGRGKSPSADHSRHTEQRSARPHGTESPKLLDLLVRFVAIQDDPSADRGTRIGGISRLHKPAMMRSEGQGLGARFRPRFKIRVDVAS